MESYQSIIHNLLEKARTYSRIKDYKSSIDCLNKVLEINQKDVFALRNKGTCYYDLQEYNKSINCFDQALEIDPK